MTVWGGVVCQGSETRMQAAGVEEEEEVVGVGVSVDRERGLDIAAARGFMALRRARAEVVLVRRNSRRWGREEGGWSSKTFVSDDQRPLKTTHIVLVTSACTRKVFWGVYKEGVGVVSCMLTCEHTKIIPG